MSKKTRSIALAIIIVAGIVGLGYVWKNFGAVPNSAEAPALSKKTSEKIMLDGKVVSEKTSDLGFIVAAQIVSISKNAGDAVKSGEVLAVQNAADIQAQVASVQASLAGAQAHLDELNHDLKKEKLKLHDFSGNAKKEQQAQVSSSKDAVDAQESTIVAMQESVKSAQAQLAKTVLRAPYDGVITRQDGQVGEIAGSSAAPFMTIASNEAPRKIEAFASDLDVANIRVGDVAKVSFDLMGQQKDVEAKVVAVDSATDSSNGKSTYKVTLMLDQSDEVIRSGMHASVVF